MSGAVANPLDQSDEDFLKQSAPAPVEEVVEEEQPAAETVETEEEEQGSEAEAGADPEDGGDDAGEAAADEPAGEGKEQEGEVAEPAKAGSETPEAKPDTAKKEEVATETASFSVPTKFRANGKDIELKNEGEALTLMQLGANYTKQMQALAPHRKLVMMLSNNQIDESKLSFLIDIEKRNPEAIKKLIKDAGIDPLDIDTSTDPNYIPGNHTVSDEQERFRATVDELGSSAEGKATVLEVTKWDQTSKDAVWANPEIMTTIHQQRETGVYDLITAEIDRRKTLGTLSASTPFLEAYKDVGMEMAIAASSEDVPRSAEPGVTTSGAATPEKVAVTTRVAEPKAPVANGDKAAAAASSRATKATAKPLVNPLAQSDDDFLKQMEGRL